MDKTCYAIGNVAKRRAMMYSGGKARKRAALQTSNPRGKWVTTIKCVSAAGTALSPLVIYKGTTPNDAWLIKDNARVEGWHYAASPKDWSNNILGYKWLWRVFAKQTSNLGRRLLIVDGHGSHVTTNFACYCMLHSIDLLVLPPHTLHKLQPLDVGVSAPLEAAMKDLARKWVGKVDNPKARMSKFEWTRT
jgi:hypothetical protein